MNDPAIIHGVVIVVRHDDTYLMIRRAEGILAAGAWCFVGGGIEPGETQAQAAVREFREEVGASIRPIRKIWEYTRPDGKLILHWWLGEFEPDAATHVSTPPTLRPNPAEVAETRWCTPAQIQELPNVLPSNLEFLQAMGSRLNQQL